ncbi:MAG: hypothetical protein QM570_00115 [Planctomycetota bacterium]|nr:hypothetical protein [Planctomycetota bacterium]
MAKAKSKSTTTKSRKPKATNPKTTREAGPSKTMNVRALVGFVPRSVAMGVESREVYDRRRLTIGAQLAARETARIARVMAIVERVQEWLADSNVRTYWLRQIEAGADDTRWAGGRRLSWPADRPAIYGILAMIGQEYSRIEIVPDELRASPWWNANRNWHWVSSEGQGRQLLAYVEKDIAERLLVCDGPAGEPAETTTGDDGSGTGGSGDDVALTDDEMEILYVLEERETLTTNDKIGAALKQRDVERSPTTIKRRVNGLRAKGLIERPEARSGVRITPAGKAQIQA